MSQWLLPVAVSLAALTLTYLFCLRPMRRGHCLHGAPTTASRPSAAQAEADDLDQALIRARAELARLRQSAATPLSPDGGGRE